MRIGFQLLSLRPGEVGGQGVFVRRLLAHLPPLLGDDRLTIFLRPELAREALFQALAEDPRIALRVQTPDAHYGDGYAAWSLGVLEQARIDVAFFPLSFFFPRPLPMPVAVHVPDIQYAYFPEYFPAEQLAWRRERIPESVRLADAVITFSRFCAAGLRERLSTAAARLHVIPAGGFTAAELHEARAGVGPPVPRAAREAGYLLYPAADWPHKNHERLLQALALLAARGRDLHLVLTGMLAQRGPALRARAERLGVAARVHFLGCVSTVELLALYRHAAALAFPSRFEGFGLPLVEAMQMECPIVASTAAGVVETVGSAAVLCADDAAAWAEKLAYVLGDAGLRSRLVRAGRERARGFDWRRCAAAHLAVLRDLAAGRQAGAGANCVRHSVA